MPKFTTILVYTFGIGQVVYGTDQFKGKVEECLELQPQVLVHLGFTHGMRTTTNSGRFVRWAATGQQSIEQLDGTWMPIVM